MNGSLLLHVCCAPCSTSVLRELRLQGAKVSGFFYNPNIHPEEEFGKRIEALRNYSAKEKLNIMIDSIYDIELFKKEVESKGGDRCEHCYRLRLERTAHCAKQNNFSAFTTTILISPYQKHDIVRQVGEEMSKKYDIEFYYQDFRPLYRGSIDLSKEMGLYRQKYCGCYLSLEEAKNAKNQNRG
ncbi:epoxyqueuosine reductase QueH [Candidatus Margulisiibacteriota bacterium]